MKKITKCVIAVVLISLLALCFPETETKAANTTAVEVQIGNNTFEAEFYDNDTAKALLELMPASYKMTELNGNEKYKYFNREFPSDEKAVGRINAGDIMLYGSDCLVVFYQSFNTPYEYTPIGRITNTDGLESAVGAGNVTVQFSVKKAVRLSHRKLTLNAGRSKTIRLKGAKVAKVRWSTSNRKVAAVSKGKIKAKRPGKATITAKYKNKKYKCKVTVRAAQKEAE